MKFSAIVITFNEEENIKRCLASVMKIINSRPRGEGEIVVVDSGSTDNTLKIAKKFNAKIYKNPLVDFASQRNFAISMAKGDWILSLDADEVISDELAKEIKETVIKPAEFDAYLVPRKNIIFGKEIKHTRWSPDKHIWLFKRGKGKFVGTVHEEVSVSGSIGQLLHAKIHNSHKNVSEFLQMTNRYTEFESEKLVKSGKKFNFFVVIFKAKRSFIGRFIVKAGYLDGWRGFVLSYLRAYYIFVTWIKLWEKTK